MFRGPPPQKQAGFLKMDQCLTRNEGEWSTCCFLNGKRALGEPAPAKKCLQTLSFGVPLSLRNRFLCRESSYKTFYLVTFI